MKSNMIKRGGNVEYRIGTIRISDTTVPPITVALVKSREAVKPRQYFLEYVYMGKSSNYILIGSRHNLRILLNAIKKELGEK